MIFLHCMLWISLALAVGGVVDIRRARRRRRMLDATDRFYGRRHR